MKSASDKETNIVRFHLYEVPRVAKFTEAGSRMVATRAGGGYLWFNGYTVSVLQDDLLEMMAVRHKNAFDITKLCA